jgi:hypothetical protein
MNKHTVALKVFRALLSNSGAVTHNPYDTAHTAYMFAEAFMAVYDEEMLRDTNAAQMFEHA